MWSRGLHAMNLILFQMRNKGNGKRLTRKEEKNTENHFDIPQAVWMLYVLLSSGAMGGCLETQQAPDLLLHAGMHPWLPRMPCTLVHQSNSARTNVQQYPLLNRNNYVEHFPNFTHRWGVWFKLCTCILQKPLQPNISLALLSSS